MRSLISDERCELFEVRRFTLGAAMTVTGYLVHLCIVP
jgi:hypothetical protein